jgi:hypothetical protein
LPPGFDNVALGKKEKEAIAAVGRNPNRKEEDVDAATQTPINTLDFGSSPSSSLV